MHVKDSDQHTGLPARLTIGEVAWMLVFVLGAVVLLALLNLGVSYALGRYDGSQDHRTWGGGPPRSERPAIPPHLMTRRER
jgi:hypothetical protein